MPFNIPYGGVIQPGLAASFLAGTRARYADQVAAQFGELAQRERASLRSAALESANLALRDQEFRDELLFRQDQLRSQNDQAAQSRALQQAGLDLDARKLDAQTALGYAQLGSADASRVNELNLAYAQLNAQTANQAAANRLGYYQANADLQRSGNQTALGYYQAGLGALANANRDALGYAQLASQDAYRDAQLNDPETWYSPQASSGGLFQSGTQGGFRWLTDPATGAIVQSPGPRGSGVPAATGYDLSPVYLGEHAPLERNPITDWFDPTLDLGPWREPFDVPTWLDSSDRTAQQKQLSRQAMLDDALQVQRMESNPFTNPAALANVKTLFHQTYGRPYDQTTAPAAPLATGGANTNWTFQVGPYKGR